MRKTNLHKYIPLQRKRERKRLKRLRHGKYYSASTTQQKVINFQKNHDINIIKATHEFELHSFLVANGNKSKVKLSNKVIIPHSFSLEESYSDTVATLAQLRDSLYGIFSNEYLIDFTHCSKVDFGALFLLRIVLEEYLQYLKNLDSKLLVLNVYPTVKITSSNNAEVNRKLFGNDIIPQLVGTSEFFPATKLPFMKGSKSQKSYAENKKGTATTKIREYINSCLLPHQFELSAEGANHFDGLISEILNNAEDHSHFNAWYTIGNSFVTPKNDGTGEVISEVNLAFLNFGYSIFDGFEASKDKNHELYGKMENMFTAVSSSFSLFKKFSKENIFTLYAFQEGFSRLKYEKPDRGSGTMKFLRSFLSLGDYQNTEKNYLPELLIFSGNTLLKCDNVFKPYAKNEEYFLSLNHENDLARPPEKSHLIELPNRFPGTCLIVKLYMNRTHFTTKLSSNGN